MATTSGIASAFERRPPTPSATCIRTSGDLSRSARRSASAALPEPSFASASAAAFRTRSSRWSSRRESAGTASSIPSSPISSATLRTTNQSL